MLMQGYPAGAGMAKLVPQIGVLAAAAARSPADFAEEAHVGDAGKVLHRAEAMRSHRFRDRMPISAASESATAG